MIKQVQNQRNQVDDEVMKEFCKDADLCPMYMVRVYLHQSLHNYQKCLEMFFKIKIIKQNVFAWLQDIQMNIKTQPDRGDGQVTTYAEMQELVLKNIGSFIEMDADSTVKLCD